MLKGSIELAHDDGWLVRFTDRADGTVNVLVTAPQRLALGQARGGRSWTTDRPTIDEAIEVSHRIKAEQLAALDGA